MRKIALILMISFFGIKSFSQSPTKTEIQDWLKEKIEAFTHDFNNPGIGEFGTDKYEVEFNDCRITIKRKYDATHSNPFNGELSKKYFYTTYEIPIKELSRLHFNDDTSKISKMVFKIKSNDSLIKVITETNYAGYSLETKYINIASLYIPNNLLKANLPERLTKAFDNLIELCGGKVTKEVF